MKSLYNEADKNEVLNRIRSLTAASPRQWGKMDVAQMLAHCHAALGTAAGLNFPKQFFIGKLISRFTRKAFLGPKEFGKNYPTDPTYVFSGQLDLETERGKVVSLVEEFYKGGHAKCTTHTHPFYGRLTPGEWGIAMYKHLDHHLRQFGA